MSTKENNTTQTEDKTLIKNILDGSILTRQKIVALFPYFIYLTVLSMLYIANRNHAEYIIKQNITTQSDVRELRAESITIAAALMYISKQTEVVKEINKRNLGLIESNEPPLILRVPKKKENKK